MYTLTASKTLVIYSESMTSSDFKSYPQMMEMNMSNFVVRVTSHYCGNGYNVDLIRWDKSGSGMKVCKAFNVSSEKADKEAQRVAELYDATIERHR